MPELTPAPERCKICNWRLDLPTQDWINCDERTCIAQEVIGKSDTELAVHAVMFTEKAGPHTVYLVQGLNYDIAAQSVDRTRAQERFMLTVEAELHVCKERGVDINNYIGVLPPQNFRALETKPLVHRFVAKVPL